MAAVDLTSSRRGIIAALALAPIAAAVPAIAIPADAGFDAAVAAYHAAWQELEDHSVYDMLGDHPDFDRVFEDCSECGSRAIAALERVMSMPARDLRQVITKMDIIWKDSGGDDMIRLDLFSFVRDDVLRLTG